MEIGLPVPEKKILKGFLTIDGHGGHLGHVTSIMSSDFHFLVPESFHRKCLLLLTFRSLAAIVSENLPFSFFPIEKPKLSNLTLP